MQLISNRIVLTLIVLALLASGAACSDGTAAPVLSDPHATPAHVPTKSEAPQPSRVPPQAPPETLSPEQRARDEAALQALIRRAVESAPPPRVLFEVKVAACCPGFESKRCMSDCSKAKALFYEDPGGKAWGLGRLFVDLQDRLWIHDSVATRAVAFDQTGDVRAIVVTGEHSYEAEELLAVTADDVRFWSPWKGGAISRFALDGSYRDTIELGPLLNSEGGRALWTLPQETHRFVLRASETFNVTDLEISGSTASFTPVRDLTLNGRTYRFACDKSGSEYRGTLTIDSQSAGIPGCPPLQYIGSDGSVIVGDARYDANAKLTGVFVAPEFDSKLGLGDRGPIAFGSDGRAYSYAALKKSVRFVELAFVPR